MSSTKVQKRTQKRGPKRTMSHSANLRDKSPVEDDWGIADMAAHFEITPRAIRFYEDKGLITPKRVRGSRVFSPTDRERFDQILRAKRLGFTLEDIREVLEVTDGAVTERTELLRRKENFKRVVKSLRRRRRDIEILAKDLLGLCAVIEDYEKNKPEAGVFQFAGAYEAMFREYLDEDFLPL